MDWFLRDEKTYPSQDRWLRALPHRYYFCLFQPPYHSPMFYAFLLHCYDSLHNFEWKKIIQPRPKGFLAWELSKNWFPIFYPERRKSGTRLKNDYDFEKALVSTLVSFALITGWTFLKMSNYTEFISWDCLLLSKLFLSIWLEST